MSTLQRAIEIAFEAHDGQVDKSGRPYICHPIAVMRYLEGEVTQICGVLHDVVEDTPVTLEHLSEELFSPEIITAIDCLTRRKNEDYWDYLARVMSNAIACRVKLADLEDNLDPRRALPHNLKYKIALRLIQEELGQE